jgi:hypothetical protein
MLRMAVDSSDAGLLELPTLVAVIAWARVRAGSAAAMPSTRSIPA